MARFFAIVCLAPLAIGFISAWSAGIGLILFMLGIPAILAALVAGSILWFVRGIRLAKRNDLVRERAAVISAVPALAVITIFVALPLLRTGDFVGSFTRLMFNKPRYERIIAQARRERERAWFKEDGGIVYSTDLGPPVRVAFNPAGMLDNWSGIIYDPTGDVMMARGFDPQTGSFYAPERVTKLFEGDLVGCRQLWTHYYSCSFT